ncbi:HD family hydrolase [Chitinophaga agrisoli]|uniref:HD family hydrolase n=1 Tax=Chitinophaga agrisoli TaxID=2607653 RepID=A0A5B2W4M9_9BACT|nr:HD family hydrolase [Chitinophaga agrisoli]KAA2245516.1 HD family hydrolase [Chitinophaga agrisoli]
MIHNTRFHPIHNVNDGVVNTLTGIVSLTAPTVEQINILDIISSLSKTCRFGGHVRRMYTVAQHCCLMASIVPPNYALEALLDDAEEAYTGDVKKPLKVLLGEGFRVIESRFKLVIAQKFGLDTGVGAREIIKEADRIAVTVEHEAFQAGNGGPLKMLIAERWLSSDFCRAWPPDEAATKLWSVFNALSYQREIRR